MLAQISFNQKRLPVLFMKAFTIPEYQEIGKKISSEESY